MTDVVVFVAQSSIQSCIVIAVVSVGSFVVVFVALVAASHIDDCHKSLLHSEELRVDILKKGLTYAFCLCSEKYDGNDS